MAMVGGGGLFEEGNYFKYSGQKGAIIQRRRLIKGRLLFKEILHSRLIHCLTGHCAVSSLRPYTVSQGSTINL